MSSPEETDPAELATRITLSALGRYSEPGCLVSVTSSAKHSRRIFMMATSEPRRLSYHPEENCDPDAGLFRISAVGSNNELAKTALTFATL